MRQGIRLIARPKTFFNQLQWSSHHWLILIAFLGLALVETQVGRQQAMYHGYATWLQSAMGLEYGAALWVVTFVRLTALVIGAMAVSAVLWMAGMLFGRTTSRRVLFRRMAVVFTVFLAGYTAQHFAPANPTFSFASVVLFVWGFVLGYHAIRQQFALNHLETVVLGLFAILLVSTSWHFTNHALERIVAEHGVSASSTAVRGATKPVLRPRF